MIERELLVVEWVDITTHHKRIAESKSATEKPVYALSVGWCCGGKDSAAYLTLTPMRFSNGDCENRTVIPRGCIKSIRRIE